MQLNATQSTTAILSRSKYILHNRLTLPGAHSVPRAAGMLLVMQLPLMLMQ